MKKLYLVLPLIVLTSLSACKKTEKKDFINVDKYVADVSATAPIMVSCMYGGDIVDYVVSSYPVIFASKQQNDKLSVYSDVAKLFGERYHTDGFPQAGLFIRSDLTENASIDNFLKAVDTSITDLVNGGTEAVKNIVKYSSDVDTQKSYFGYAAGVIKNVQQTNGMAFIEREKNPSLTEYKKFEEPLGISLAEADLSSYYSKAMPSEALAPETLEYKVTVPMGAPNAVFAKYAGSSNLTITSPANVKQAFTAKQADFIIFDSVNGLNLSKVNDNSYKLVRMVTFGNLYVVSTGNDEDGKLDEEDLIVGYGENLVPDLAFKAVYSK